LDSPKSPLVSLRNEKPAWINPYQRIKAVAKTINLKDFFANLQGFYRPVHAFSSSIYVRSAPF
jgi:hypothetical protein